ncbi:hypothetical protein FS837_001757 [Tulasnella sp. UAMH 9824]|nr:hypothetical protein FS837_001757 [Tulasnella sp. UAMH 9824]
MSSTNQRPVQAASVLKYTPVEEIPHIRDHVKATFDSGRLRPLQYRKEQLLRLAHLIEDNYTRFEEAYKLDLGRHKLEVTACELDMVVTEIMYFYNNFETWAQPQKPPFDIKFWAFGPVIRKVPKGVVLMIGPFNAGAIASGNACVVKMSELVPHVSALVTELFPKYLDQDLFRVVNGAVPETTALLDLQWDHIIFTGSATVGKIVSAAAAKHLTPITLELGGKNPVFYDPKMDPEVTARRVLWAKTMNAGQICNSPNHVFVPVEAQEELADAFIKVYKEFYPDGAENAPITSLVNDAAFNRVKQLLEKTRGEVVCGGQLDEKRRWIAPTVLKNVELNDVVLESELFGPILPIVPVKDIQEAINFTRSQPHPLSLYVFTDDRDFEENVFNQTQSGQFMRNDCCVQASVKGMPFGGVGESGHGMLLGQYTFDTLSHFRNTASSPRLMDSLMGWRFPPYTDAKIKQAAMMKPRVPALNPGWGEWLRSWTPL